MVKTGQLTELNGRQTLLLDPELNRTMEFSANMKEGFP